jgi:acetylornithine/N-succinyldiaminopimelate aminotransferase
LRAAIGPDTAALMVEPVQGEGGVRLLSPAFIRALRALCDEHGLMLIFDEIQTGVGRTGKLFAYEWSGISPDIMSVAKGIGGGFPMGACLATAEAAKGMTAGTHGSTFGGNPLAMAVGNAVLDVVLGPGFLERVERMGLLMKQRLAELKDRHPAVISEIRGTGLLLGLRTNVPNTEVVAAARAEKLLVITAGDNVVRLAPPLIVDEGDVGEAVARLDRACTAIERELQGVAARGAAE